MSMTMGLGWTVEAFASETITVADTSIGVTTATSKSDLQGAGAKYAFFTVEAAPLRYWLDGSNPTSTVGHLVQVGENFEVHGEDNVRKLRMIRTTSTSATVSATYAR